MRINFELSSHGTLYLLRPVSRAASAWVEEHLPVATWFGGAVVVEHRYIGAIIGGAIGDGLEVRGWTKDAKAQQGDSRPRRDP